MGFFFNFINFGRFLVLSAHKDSFGVLLTFDFRKEKNKESKAKWVDFDGKKIFEVIV